MQVLADSLTIRWMSGHQTVLPYLPKETEDGVINVLDDDQEYVIDLAQFPEATPGSNFVAFLSRHDSYLQLIEAAREVLSLNKTVVIRGYCYDWPVVRSVVALVVCGLVS